MRDLVEDLPSRRSGSRTSISASTSSSVSLLEVSAPKPRRSRQFRQRPRPTRDLDPHSAHGIGSPRGGAQAGVPAGFVVTSKKLKTDAMYSASFPTLLHVLLRKPSSEVQYKVENRRETLVADVVKKARLHAAVSPQRPIAIFARQLLRTNSRSDLPDEDQYM